MIQCGQVLAGVVRPYTSHYDGRAAVRRYCVCSASVGEMAYTPGGRRRSCGDTFSVVLVLPAVVWRPSLMSLTAGAW